MSQNAGISNGTGEPPPAGESPTPRQSADQVIVAGLGWPSRWPMRTRLGVAGAGRPRLAEARRNPSRGAAPPTAARAACWPRHLDLRRAIKQVKWTSFQTSECVDRVRRPIPRQCRPLFSIHSPIHVQPSFISNYSTNFIIVGSMYHRLTHFVYIRMAVAFICYL